MSLLEYRRDFVSEFWTSGNDFLVEKTYTWCVVFNNITEKTLPWKASEPSNKGHCVYVEMRNETSATVTMTEDCASKRKFICEVRARFY